MLQHVHHHTDCTEEELVSRQVHGRMHAIVNTYFALHTIVGLGGGGRGETSEQLTEAKNTESKLHTPIANDALTPAPAHTGSFI